MSRSNHSVLVAIATPAAQALVRTPGETPIVYAAVADPQGAGVLPSDRATGIQNAGPHIIEAAIAFMDVPNRSRIAILSRLEQMHAGAPKGRFVTLAQVVTKLRGG